MLIDEDIIKECLLKNISDKYKINYNDLLFELNNLPHKRTVKSKYSVDHMFFSRDNERSFYWAGFIAADGCVFSKTAKPTRTNITTPDSTSKIKYCGKSNVKDLVNYLYQDATVFMDRKYNIAQRAL